MQERFKPYCAVHLFLIKFNEILLLRRANTGYEDGNYSVPAGHIDGNESVKNAMCREAFEEACIVLKPENLSLAHVMHRNAPDGYEFIDFFFFADTWEGEIKIGEIDKCDELAWFNIITLPSNTIPYVKTAISHYLNKQIFSEHEWR